MERRQNGLPQPAVVDPTRYGVSFSLKQCRSFGLDPHDTLRWLTDEAGFRRFRLMSYWDEHEQAPGHYDFSELDWQLDMIKQVGGIVSLCLGARQPRWPENHWPNWVWKAPKGERSAALMRYIRAIVKRYRGHPALESYQLENEALLKSFGTRSEIDRPRLRQEYELVKELDPNHPVIMTTSNSWGIPIRRPIPDIVGFSYYHTLYNGKRYTEAGHFAWLHHKRSQAISVLLGRPSFIHELQLEPWGPKAIWEMPISEQDKSMSPTYIVRNLERARNTGIYPIDLWGGEWWYWRLAKQADPVIWQTVRKSLQ